MVENWAEAVCGSWSGTIEPLPVEEESMAGGGQRYKVVYHWL
jgi:hypothetical protein